ncbi:MAG: hypothetical protein EAX96_16860 [Candidatus Lokiarchaeota archaeon]|nr:hypothetical protein [Candidatus Lokiarchaeota archaeon]
MREIEEIWIINESGITLFNFSKDELDPTLFGGFISAIQNFIKEIGNQKIESIIMGSSQLTLLKSKYDLIFVARSDKKIKKKNIEKHLNTVVKSFFELYEDEVKDWDCDSTKFDDFKDVIEYIFDDKPESKFEKSFW